jgi:hypothetical protein
MLPSADLLSTLENKFNVVWISGDGEEINVGCPYCLKIIGKPDRSGHLGLNFGKDAAHCVRCGWGRRGLRKWLKTFQITSTPDFYQAGVSIQNFLHKEVVEATYKYDVVELPSGCRKMRESDFSRPTAYGHSLAEKGISFEEAERHDLYACESGKYDGYVIFPFYEHGDLVYFQGRAATPRLLDNPKTKKRNPSNEEMLGKAYWLYGMERAVIGGSAYLCEGTLDDISLTSYLLDRHGESHFALGMQGMTMSWPSRDRHALNSQYGKLASLKLENIFVVLDAGWDKQSDALRDILAKTGLPSHSYHLLTGDPNEVKWGEMDRCFKANNKLDKLSLKLEGLRK